jgi:hypothetical protein
VQIRGDEAMFMAFKEVLAEFLGSKEPEANDSASDGKSELQISPGGFKSLLLSWDLGAHFGDSRFLCR